MGQSVVILLAAGRGSRMGGAVDDKILAPLAGRPVFAHSLEAFAQSGVVQRWVIVYRDAAQRAKLARVFSASGMDGLAGRWVRGGQERQDSVARALACLPAAVEFVFIHDCARPLVRPESLRTLAEALQRDGAACLAHRVTDTIKVCLGRGAGPVRRRWRTLDRSRLWALETPQAFARTLICRAYEEVQRRGLRITDDAQAVELTGRAGLTLLENTDPNPKITRPADLSYAEFLLRQRADAAHRAAQPPAPRPRPPPRAGNSSPVAR